MEDKNNIEQNMYEKQSTYPEQNMYEEQNDTPDFLEEQERIRESNLQEFYNSAYYQNVQRKRNNRKTILGLLLIVAVVYFGFVVLGGALLASKDKNAATEGEKLEKEIEDKYGVVVNTGEEINDLLIGYEILVLDSSTQTYEALQAIDEVLSRLPQGFIDEISQKDEGRYLEINVTSEMMILGDGGYAAGLTSFAADKNVVRIDATSGMSMDLQETVAHEIFHLIDYEMKEFDEYSAYIDEWKMYNPTGFEYSVWQSGTTSYLLSGSDITNTYFVSAYSKQDIFEDRAEIFSHLLATDEDEELPECYDSKYVKAKCKLLINEISYHFESVGYDGMYINRWFD